MTTTINTGVFLTDVDTIPQFQLGSTAEIAGRLWMYIRAGAAIAANDVLIADTSVAAELGRRMVPSSAANQSPRAIAQSAISSGNYGWVLIRGQGVAKLATGVAAGASLATTSTAGTVGNMTVSASPTQGEVTRIRDATGGRSLLAVTAEASGVGTVLIA